MSADRAVPLQTVRKEGPVGRIASNRAGAHSPETTSDSTKVENTALSHARGLTTRLKPVWEHRWFAWIHQKFTWNNLKPVIRSAIALWICWILQLIPQVEAALGYAAFFVLIVTVIIPPWQPVVQNLEAYANLLFFCGVAWAWGGSANGGSEVDGGGEANGGGEALNFIAAPHQGDVWRIAQRENTERRLEIEGRVMLTSCLAIFIANRSRYPTSAVRIQQAEQRLQYLSGNHMLYQERLLYDGTYVDAISSVVCAVFLCTGSAFLLWYKLKTQPSPATMALVLSCILLDVCLTTAHYYPTAQYNTGLLFFLPMVVSTGICILASVTIFPESVAHSFRAKFPGVLLPLNTAVRSVEELFEEATCTPLPEEALDSEHPAVLKKIDQWTNKSKTIRAQLVSSLAGLPALRAQQRYLAVDFSYSRLSSVNLRDLFDDLAILQARSSGLAFFFDILVSNARHSHLDSAVQTVRQTLESRPASRPASVHHELPSDDDDSSHERSYLKRHLPEFIHRKSSSAGLGNSHQGSHISLFEKLRKAQQPVGLYESQRYMELEKAFDKHSPNILAQLDILAGVSLPLIQACGAALGKAAHWLTMVDKKSRSPIETELHILRAALLEYKEHRSDIIRPFQHIFDPNMAQESASKRFTHHRGLFQNFVAQYHIIEFSEALLALIHRMDSFDQLEPDRRLWYPRPSRLLRHFRNSHVDRHVTDGEDGNDNDPAFNPEVDDALGEAKKRNPEYAPFQNPTLQFISRIAAIGDISHSRSLMYAIKAGVMTAVTTLPAFLVSSGSFYYFNRGVWATIMSQLTLAVYSGDTTFALVKRIIATFWGGTFGMLVWYIGSGSSSGSPYGLAAIAIVAFPMAMYFRIHFPYGVLTAIMGPVTFTLVLGYSYINGSLAQLTDVTWGWDVAWRRFVTVSIGITVAWIFSYLPPSYSARRAIRYSYSQTIAAVGSIFCDVLSHANDYHRNISEDDEIRQKLLTWRTKLSKLGIQHTHATYEYSLRGNWPIDRYQALLEALQDTLSLLSQLNHVLSQLERPWRKALLERTRLSEHAFLGDVLAVITMCSTALKSETPLPQITPSPLVSRFRMGHVKGVDLPHDISDELPSLVTIDVLESEQYMRYALGISTTFSLLARLDRIVVICKTLLGESYHISGLQLE